MATHNDMRTLRAEYTTRSQRFFQLLKIGLFKQALCRTYMYIHVQCHVSKENLVHRTKDAGK